MITPRGVGPGEAPYFLCPACRQPRPMKGRTRRRIRGLGAFVCLGCGNATQNCDRDRDARPEACR